MIKLHGNARDLTNQRFGKLTVLYPTSRRENRSIIWHCKCDCGKETEVPSKRLTYGYTQSCGCAYSLGETHIQQILDNHNISYKKEYTIVIQNKKLRYDFAVLDKNNQIIQLIEFDGPHHTAISTQIYSAEKCRITQENDLIKNKWAIDNNIPLIRIPYSQRDKITKEMLFSNKYLIKS